MSKISVKQAALLTGKSRETINNATKEGKISYSLNSRNHKEIDVAELERIYPLVKNMEQISQESQSGVVSPVESGEIRSDSQAQIQVLQQKLTSSEELKETITTERQRERKQLESEIENLRSSLEKTQEQHSKAMLLITHQGQTESRDVTWEKSFKALEARLANQEKSNRVENERSEKVLRQNRLLKRILLEERNKSLWKKLFR